MGKSLQAEICALLTFTVMGPLTAGAGLVRSYVAHDASDRQTAAMASLRTKVTNKMAPWKVYEFVIQMVIVSFKPRL